jgi:hypothetical protein
MSEVHDIFVRAHTVVRPQRPSPAKWPEHVLVIDTETTINIPQRLTFGVYWRCKLGAAGYQFVEEGLLYADALDVQQREVLERYVHDPKNVPGIEVKMFPPRIELNLYSQSKFLERVFWRAIRKAEMVVGFNLPFDLSQLALKSSPAGRGGWSLVMSLRKSRKTGEMEPNPERPRVVITSKDSKMAFIELGSILHRREWPNGGRFLDPRTLGWALRNESYNLEDACKAFNVPGKMKHKPTGRVTVKEINYCRQDARATVNLLNAMKREFDQHPFELRPDKAYSPASIAKAYLNVMRIAVPKAKFNVLDREQGIAMQGYFGGRAECRIRKTPVPIVHTDFTSQYPTVNALLGNWDLLTAESVGFEDSTDEVRKMLAEMELENTFNPSFWKRLSFFALVRPDRDILPVRTVYNGRTQNIGLNYLTSEKPIWFAGPDLVVSCLHTGKAPEILKAIRMVPHGQQQGLETSNLAGMVTINPGSDDFFCRVIEQKSEHKPSNKPLARFLKILGNSGSYGLFVEMNQEKTRKPVNVKVFSGEMIFERPYSVIEKAGRWYFPPLASLITAGGRLLLTMLERCVTDASGSYLFCDTDSLCIVSSEHGELVPCLGGTHKLDDGREAVKALSWKEVQAIAAKFNTLNPYSPSLVRDILKIEDINFVDSDPQKGRHQLFGYAISAKRYALYTQTDTDICIVKASGHGLGYLYPPKDGFNKDADAPIWVMEAWDWLLRKELGLARKEPAWLDLPAMMRMALTSPNVMRNYRPEWLAPYSFFFFPLLSDLGGYPAGYDRSNFKFITPFNSDREKWGKLEGINLCDKQHFRVGLFPNGKQNKVVPESFRIILRLYLRRPESKSLAPDESPCVADTQGLLGRASVVAGEIIPVGKETDRHWEQGEDMSLLDFKVLEYLPAANMVVANQILRDEITRLGIRETMRRTRLSQHTIEAIRAGQPIRRATLCRIQAAMGSRNPNWPKIEGTVRLN